jgi:hypothetical protein
LLRTAVLLRLDEGKEPFTAIVKVDATADMAYSYELRGLSGRIPDDTPITF